LLVFDPLINSEGNIEFRCFRAYQKLAILESSKSGVTSCLAIVTGQRIPESLVNALVDQNAHLGTCKQKVFCFFESGEGGFA